MSDRRPNRKAKPNFELLRDAYAILGGIPQEVIDLDAVERKRGEALDCGTIACGMGWLAHHPQFQQLGLTPKQLCSWEDGASSVVWKGNPMDYDDAAQYLFNLTRVEADMLFGPTEWYRPADEAKLHHKNILLNRIKKLLIKHKQPVISTSMLPEQKDA